MFFISLAFEWGVTLIIFFIFGMRFPPKSVNAIDLLISTEILSDLTYLVDLNLMAVYMIAPNLTSRLALSMNYYCFARLQGLFLVRLFFGSGSINDLCFRKCALIKSCFARRC